MQKTLLIVLAVLVVLGAGWYLFSTYLVSKLDGTGGVTAPQEEQGGDRLVRYESSGLGIAFTYLENRYTLTTHTNGSAEREWQTITLVPSDFMPVEGGEGPPAITISILDNPEKLTLEQWIKGDSRSNWKLAPDNAQLRAATVGGEEGFAYQHSGLYETDAVAVMHDGKVYLFEGGWLTTNDEIRRDFERLLEKVEFN
jgi:hypothetical protein